jgi:hypothetical protein
MPINSQSPTLGNTFIGQGTSQSPNLGGGRMFPVRVIDVSLGSSSNSKSLFQVTKGWWGIGAIRFEPLNENSLPKEFPQGNIALPLDTNFKKLPLINEVVFIIPGPSLRFLEDGNTDAIDFYYINALTLWNSNHVNALPSLGFNANQTTDNVSNSDIDKGIENNTDDKVEDIAYGKTFTENGRIKNLYPNEGDVIIEGRFGNSIRFGSTAKQPSGSTNIESPWSTTGENGSPITIIRNGQSKADIDFNNWYPIYEDIQNDDSSIYMTSGQTIPVVLGSTNFASFGVDAVPVANTTKLLQDVPVDNSTKSNKELDSADKPYDIVNVEPIIEPITQPSTQTSPVNTPISSTPSSSTPPIIVTGSKFELYGSGRVDLRTVESKTGKILVAIGKEGDTNQTNLQTLYSQAVQELRSKYPGIELNIPSFDQLENNS